ncbi:MGAT4C [Symbiodinium natans]|uniref:MGAT4C protein n=1 Tax=Symbiodinium natans TaxID=878477 RepID=A0A812R424_9DINO|nr:MGAT4C [Symbiodinium natans]
MTDADEDACIEEVPLEHFHTWLQEAGIRPSEILHLKGFGGNVPGFFDKEAVAKASQSSLLVWDGDEFQETSFTRLIPDYLKCGEGRRPGHVQFVTSAGVTTWQDRRLHRQLQEELEGGLGPLAFAVSEA